MPHMTLRNLSTETIEALVKQGRLLLKEGPKAQRAPPRNRLQHSRDIRAMSLKHHLDDSTPYIRSDREEP